MFKMAGLGGLLVAALALTGCNFFVDDTTTTTASGTGSTTGDYVYVVNSAANTLSGYSVGTNTLTVLTGLNSLALQTNLLARSVAITQANTYLYVGGNQAINCYAIASDGTLTAVTASQTLVGTADIVSMDTSVDGKWLFAVDAINRVVNVYSINSSTGVLTLSNSAILNVPLGTAVTMPVVKVQPITSPSIVVVSMNASGTGSYAFNDSTGLITYVGTTQATNLSDNGVTFDSTGTYAYVVRADTTGLGTSGISEFTVAANGVLNGTTALTATGTAPSYAAFDKSGKYLYVANYGAATISGYTLSSGTPTVLASSPYVSSGGLRQLTADHSGTYMLGINDTASSSNLSLYALDATTAGKLDAAVPVSTGTAGVVALAATH